MKTIDPNYLSAHVIIERKWRLDWIEKTVGFGNTVAEAPDRKDPTLTDVITDTGVYAVLTPDGMVVTCWIAQVYQAKRLCKKANNMKAFYTTLYNVVNYNNNTREWREMVA